MVLPPARGVSQFHFSLAPVSDDWAKYTTTSLVLFSILYGGTLKRLLKVTSTHPVQETILSQSEYLASFPGRQALMFAEPCRLAFSPWQVEGKKASEMS